MVGGLNYKLEYYKHIKVHNGVMIDAEPIDSHGADWHLFENYDFQDWWFSGPIEIPE